MLIRSSCHPPPAATATPIPLHVLEQVVHTHQQDGDIVTDIAPQGLPKGTQLVFLYAPGGHHGVIVTVSLIPATGNGTAGMCA